MIIFNGNALESITAVRVADVYISPIQLSPQARQRSVQFGADFVRMGGGTRSVRITFALISQDKMLRQEYISQIAQWARKDGEGKLQLPGYNGKYLSCRCTQLPALSVREWWDKSMTLTFTCFDNPYWTDIAEKTAACGTAFSVVGSAQDGPFMRIERTLSSAVSNQTYSNGKESMTFSSIPKGEMIIDLNRQTAAVNGTSIMQYYTFTSDFLLPRPGLQTISGTGTVKWRERWE